MDAVTINRFKRGNIRESNYRLLNEPVSLKVRIEHVPTTEECRWDDDGGAQAPLVREETITEKYRGQKIGLCGSRKQLAARMVVPRESIKIVQRDRPLTPKELEKTQPELARDVQVAALEARVAELMGLVEQRKLAAEKKRRSLAQLERLFNVTRKVKA